MSEEITGQTMQEETAAETSAAFDEGFDDDWSVPDFTDGQSGEDEGFGDPETAEEGEGTEADADQQEAEGTDGEGADAGDEGGPAVDGESETEGESKGNEGSPDQGESFVLKHLGEEKAVGRDEVVALAQKGMDYDRIREKWDGVKDDVTRLRMYEDFLGELAKARGGTGDIKDEIASLIDETRIRTMMARAEAEGKELSPAAAAAQAVKIRTEFVSAGTAIDPEEARQEKSLRETERFMQEYPEVPATDIPKEVWDKVNQNGGDLVAAYMQYENRNLKAELKALKKDLEEMKQQKKNKQRSTGSAKSSGSAAKRDAFDEGWDYE